MEHATAANLDMPDRDLYLDINTGACAGSASVTEEQRRLFTHGIADWSGWTDLGGQIQGAPATVSRDPSVWEYPSTRVAAAHATRRLSAQVAAPVLARLVTDDDAGVRKVAINAVRESGTPELREALERAVEDESHAPLRALGREAMARFGAR